MRPRDIHSAHYVHEFKDYMEEIRMEKDTQQKTVGIKKGVEIKGSKEEKGIVQKLSEFFGVSFSREQRFKYTSYSFHFLQPGNQMKVNYNFSNEILLLFSSHRSFDTRTFDFVDKILEDYSNRLDKLCIFLVSNDPAFIQRITKLIEDQRDFRLVVPFVYNEMLSSNFSEQFLHDRMRDYLYSRDLFAFESPIRSDDYFFGRSHVVQKLYSKYSAGEQGGLFGLRKSGKTSVLYALERTMIHRSGKSIYIDCQNPSIHQSRWFELLETLIKRIITKYKIPSINEQIIGDYNEKNAAEMFEKDLSLLSDCLDKRILFIFDEVESITYKLSPNKHWEDGRDFLFFWQTLRSVYQNNTSIFTFIIAGVNPMAIEFSHINKYDNPIFSLIEPVYLEFFNLQDVKHMVTRIGGYMGLSFDEEIFTHLVDDYGGHPFLIRQVCSIMNSYIKNKPQKIDKYSYKEWKKDFNSRMSSYMEQIVGVLKKWYPHELELLSILSVDGNQKFTAEIKSQSEINHLMGYGVLHENNGRFSIKINCLNDYVREMYIDKSIPEKLDEKWARISKRRNAIETKLRQVILTSLEVNKGKSSTKNILLGTVPTNLRAKIRDHNPKSIIEDHLYFSDYKKIIVKNWECFENVFSDKQQFTMCMDIINKHRVDAHAKKISHEEYFQVNYAMEWLEEKLPL